MTYRCFYTFTLIFLLSAAACTNTGQAVKSGLADTMVAMKTGNAEQKGDAAYAAKNYAEALSAYRKAAEAGGKHSQFMLANMYLAGEGVKRDPEQYLAWMRQSAGNGYPPANYLMGMVSLRSNPAAAAKHFMRAAEGEHGAAMHMLGLMYAGGTGVPQSEAEALRWFRMAAAQGIPVQKGFMTEAGLQSYRNSLKAPGRQVAEKGGKGLIREIQQRLKDLGYQPGAADGVPGSKTRAAIEAYQRANGLQPDGLASAALLESLRGQAN